MTLGGEGGKRKEEIKAFSDAAMLRWNKPTYAAALSSGASRGALRRLQSDTHRAELSERLRAGRGRSVWEVISPSGERYTTDNLSAFAKTQGVPRGRLAHAAANTERRPSGWQVTKISHDTSVFGGPSCIALWELSFPCGKTEVIENLEEYCRTSSLPFGKIYRTHRYKRKSKDGWLAIKKS